MRLTCSTDVSWPAALDRLLSWKSEATPAAQSFVSTYGDFLHQLFAELASAGAARIVELCAGDRPLAAAIVLDHRNTRYLYNMSYDQAFTRSVATGVAPGVVLVSHLVEQTLDAGHDFDFLRGAQDYKLRLGGVPESMIAIRLQRWSGDR